MSSTLHTFGPTCIFHDDEAASAWSESSEPPPIKAQFFYVSSVPLDDPLSPLPSVPTDSRSAQSHQPQPFSIRDNAALAEAWHGVEDLLARLSDKDAERASRPQLGERGTTLGELVRFPRFRADGQSQAGSYLTEEKPTILQIDSEERGSIKSPDFNSRTRSLKSPRQKPNRSPDDEAEASHDNKSDGDGEKKRRPFSPFRKTKAADEGAASEVSPIRFVQIDDERNADISGRPFARTPSVQAGASRADQDTVPSTGEPQPHPKDISGGLRSSPGHSKLHGTFYPRKEDDEDGEPESKKTLIPVGISRLHLVEMPDLLLKPIYWSPVNDISAVVRGTWFYVKTMLPVEVDLANWLETGYHELKPWTDTWQDELNSCAEIGAEAEVKSVYHLFPERKAKSSGAGVDPRPGSSNASRGDHWSTQEPSVEHENKAAGPRSAKYRVTPSDSSLRYKNHRVIFVDGNSAQILRPSLAPSVSRNRKPLAAVRKGREIGVPVCRGFNRRSWLKSNPPSKMNSRSAHAAVGAYISQSDNADTQDQRISCPACKIEQQKNSPRVTDLVLVIHGIGQKLSERMDSFHFTHAINSFRREVNVELSSEMIRGSIRKEQGGIMVLPVNWRLTVSFEDSSESKDGNGENDYQLDDITPDTLPALRSLISDVMLDIPYYLSHHKEKMISAVIREANRVYRLWCRNNPGFHDAGRVHLIAHSLGSAMAVDILSQQPTIAPRPADAVSDIAKDNVFEFDTKSLFSCGSPAGFFLLLNKANLVPRKGRHKPGTDGEGDGVPAGEAGKYGCLAVDNLYNVMAPYDPISYRMNAAVDSEYAASLKPAIIPGIRQGFLAGIGLKWGSSVSERPFGLVSSPQTATLQRPGMTKLPSTIEMDTHNFTREELAEKSMHMLNDNGQIDFTLSADGGPLDFQYWNMLSAHSSYWLRQDFVRFLVVEIGREPGRQGTLTALRAQKKRAFKAARMT